MKVTLTSETSIRAEGAPELSFEAGDEHVHISAFHLLAAGLAFCTYSVLYVWAQNARLDSEELALEVGWSFAEKPSRIDAINMVIDWPTLPRQRHRAAEKAAEQCTVHATLVHGTEMRVSLREGSAEGERSVR
jgi:uncharacterized OsmC-like protein